MRERVGYIVGLLGIMIRVFGGFAVIGMVLYALYVAFSESIKAGAIIFAFAIGASWIVVLFAGICDKVSGME